MVVVGKVAKEFFDGVWAMMTEVDFPGLGVSFANAALALLLIRFSIRIFGFFTGFHTGSDDLGRAESAANRLKAQQARYDRKHKSGGYD